MGRLGQRPESSHNILVLVAAVGLSAFLLGYIQGELPKLLFTQGSDDRGQDSYRGYRRMPGGMDGQVAGGMATADHGVVIAAQAGDAPGSALSSMRGEALEGSHSMRHPTWIPQDEHRAHIDASFLRGKKAQSPGGKAGGMFGKKTPQVAICLGYTTKTKNKARQGVYGVKGQSPLFNHLIPSLCKTLSPGFKYSMWLGYDHDDPILSLPGAADLMLEAIKETTGPGCDIDTHLIRMEYGGNPTWAQNDAILAAHKAGADYFYRVNDDSVLASQQWTEKFVSALASMNPPNVGVVGPAHTGGNTRILTYDFTSRKHVEIFGFHYPRAFRSWWGDDWITLVYSPGHMKKLPDVKLDHKLEDIRYSVGEDMAKLGVLQREVDLHKATLQQYINKHPAGRRLSNR